MWIGSMVETLSRGGPEASGQGASGVGAPIIMYTAVGQAFCGVIINLSRQTTGLDPYPLN